jgi:hypothetical protein
LPGKHCYSQIGNKNIHIQEGRILNARRQTTTRASQVLFFHLDKESSIPLDMLQQDPINIPGISPLGTMFPPGNTQEYDITRLVTSLKFHPSLSLQV